MTTCDATKPGKYGVDFHCGLPDGHDGPHTEYLSMPIPGQVGFTHSWTGGDREQS